MDYVSKNVVSVSLAEVAVEFIVHLVCAVSDLLPCKLANETTKEAKQLVCLQKRVCT